MCIFTSFHRYTVAPLARLCVLECAGVSARKVDDCSEIVTVEFVNVVHSSTRNDVIIIHTFKCNDVITVHPL